MIRRTIGTILVVVASVLTFMLVTGGGPIFPHIIGPITLAVIGVILLTLKKKANDSAK